MHEYIESHWSDRALGSNNMEKLNCHYYLTTIYVALIRSILEYCCVVWHNAIPCHLSDDLERIQKRAMRIIYPGQTYKEALLLAGCPRLDARREDLCVKF